MAEKNFLLLNRNLLDHWLWQDKPFAKGQAWVDLLALANHTEKKAPHRGNVVTCKRGDVNISLLELSGRWGWSRGKVKRFLDCLESDGMVKLNVSKNRTTITVENYEKYQHGRTSDGHKIEQRTDITKESKRRSKNVNKVKECILPRLGEFENVELTEEELEKLKERFPYDWQERIERLSSYMSSKGKRYKSHYATILTWSRKDEERAGRGNDFMDL